ncbi:MAG: TIGR04282 family arsenosugar biosynthesis glycosyltransferase [Taibaiella sp.]|nr:TIGR04282 family arsenosugar biosynthesis glycosyltransferase [Taibaiella sp.]
MNSHRSALIIFARKPELGKVKTRLAAGIGLEKALAVYIKLLEHTRNITSGLPCDKYVFVTAHNDDKFWEGYQIELQQNETLGDRMHHAFEILFAKGYKKVVIIGSDCPLLKAEDIKVAYEALDKTNIVIGPTFDGGYYLLGMNQLYQQLFINKAWSTDTVFRDTINDINTASLSVHVLRELADLDEEKDMPSEWL